MIDYGDGTGAFSGTTAWHWGVFPDAHVLTGDFDGDGFWDVGLHNPNNLGNLYIQYGNGTGWFGNQTEWHWGDFPIAQFFTGDFNGDGLWDIGLYNPNNLGNFYIDYGDGTGAFGGTTAWHWGVYSNDNVFTGDFGTGPSSPPPPRAVPYFSQRDSRWINHLLRTNGVCSVYCNTIGKCGCTLTSAAMVFKYYGADLNPATLSDCMWTQACPFYWGTGASCSGGSAQWVAKYNFSWSRLEHELNDNERPVILGMHKYIGDVLHTHWVVVLSGSGDNPANYTIHDPWPINGANMKLNAYNSWYLDWLAIYAGQPACGNLTTVATDLSVFHPQPVIAATNPETVTPDTALSIAEAQSLTASPIITGSVWLYRMTDVTMTLQLVADSEAGLIAEMLIWTDAMTQTTWQPFSTFTSLPVSSEIYARFRDASDHISETRSDTLYPVASPTTAPFEVFLSVVLKR
jgi:hypothetical protein